MDNLVQGSYEGVIAVVEYDYKAKEVDELDLVKGQIIHNITQQPGGWWEGTLVVSGKIGMFPDNFVRVLDNNEDTPVVLRDKSSIFQRKCKAIYSYTQVNEDELTLAVGDVIEFLGEVEEGWWRGKLNNKIGVFPSNFVIAIQASPVFATKRPTPSAEPNTSAQISKAINTAQKLTTNSLTKNPKNCTTDRNSNNRLASCFDAPSEKSTAPDLPPRPVREFCRVEFPYSPQNDDELELVVGELIAIVNKELADKGWWKGEVNGKVGVFPDNFVKLIPLDESPVKEIRTAQTDSLAKPNGKKGVNSTVPNTNRVESFGSRDSLDDILNETGLQSGNVAAQRKSLENKNLELNIPSASVDRTSKHLDHKTGETRKSIENLDEKKVPPPLLTKKPVVAGKKSSGVTTVTGTILPGLKQKVKNIEQKHNMSQDLSDGVTSSKLNLESLKNGEKDRFIASDNDFDKVERGSILQDMRAGRVKAPKRRPPSVAANLLTESIARSSVCLNGDDSFDEFKNLPLSSADSDEQIRPKSREWEKKKVPWMDELKASQVKKKTSPYIEPRTTLIDITTATSEEKQITPPLMLNVNISKNKKVLDTNMTTSSQCVVTKTTASSSIYQLDNKMDSETDVTKSISVTGIEKTSPRDSISADDSESKSSSKNQATKTGVTRMQTQQFKSSVVVHSDGDTEQNALEGSKIVEFEKRIKNLEAIVQLQQKAIDEMQRMLRDESNRVELLKTQLEKYAQCVTQV